MTRIKIGTLEWKVKNFEECKAEIKALADNDFVKNAKIIRDIGRERVVDQGVALDMYINENYTPEERKMMNPKAIADFRKLYQKFYLDYVIEVMEAMAREEEKFL